MTRCRFSRGPIWITVAVGLVTSVVCAEQAALHVKKDVGKGKVEMPTKALIARTAGKAVPATHVPPYLSKTALESPVEAVVVTTAGSAFSNRAPTTIIKKVVASKYEIEKSAQTVLPPQSNAAPPLPAFINPKVSPGKIDWHKNFTAAHRAARKSGKPVLLFQMMGKLDDQFC